MIKRFRLWLGPERIQALFLLLAGTGTASLILNAVGNDGAGWVTPAQNVLLLVFIGGAAIILGGKMDRFERGRWLGILAPAFGLVLLGIFFLQDQLMLLMGGAVGWVLAAMFLFKPHGPMAYQSAIKAFRNNNYKEAVDTLGDLIKQEPDVPEHYRLRAEFFRVWGKLDRAKKDYQKVAALLPDDWLGQHGIAEVELQQYHLDAAREAALKAYAIAPDQWVITYNLGMIEDRANQPEAALRYLDETLANKVPESHYRFLIHFYRARSHARMGDRDAADAAAKQMQKHAGGLNQWQIILQSDQADTLRAVLGDDIRTAERLFNGEIWVQDLTD